MTAGPARPVVLITQRLLTGGPNAAGHDALDRRWHATAERWGLRLLPLPNDLAAARAVLNPAPADVRGLILSGGGDLSGVPGGRSPDLEREAVERWSLEWIRDRDLGVLGVCRGAQVLWRDAGGELAPVGGHSGALHAVHPTNQGQTAGVTPGRVNSFHAYAFASGADDAIPLAYAGDGVLEAFSLRDGRELAVMWHPERPGNTNDIVSLVHHLFTRSDA